MKMKKATENQAQPVNVSHKLVDKSIFWQSWIKMFLPGLGNLWRIQQWKWTPGIYLGS